MCRCGEISDWYAYSVIGVIFKKIMKLEDADSKNFENQEWLTTEEAADYLRISVGRLRNMTSNGYVPFYKLGRSNRYLKEELRKMLLDNRRGPWWEND